MLFSNGRNPIPPTGRLLAPPKWILDLQYYTRHIMFDVGFTTGTLARSTIANILNGSCHSGKLRLAHILMYTSPGLPPRTACISFIHWLVPLLYYYIVSAYLCGFTPVSSPSHSTFTNPLLPLLMLPRAYVRAVFE